MTEPVAVVTGASRGAGRGIATALAARGWRVYGTGRTISDTPAGVVAVRLDHRDDAAVRQLFERVEQESGRLDLLVNNAAVISDELVGPQPFWEKPRELADVLDRIQRDRGKRLNVRSVGRILDRCLKTAALATKASPHALRPRSTARADR